MARVKKRVVVWGSVGLCAAAALCVIVVLIHPLLINNPNPTPVLSAAVANFFREGGGDADTDEVFRVGSDVFFCGGDDLAACFDFSEDVDSVGVCVIIDGDTNWRVFDSVPAKDFEWRLFTAASAKSYRLFLQFVAKNGVASGWDQVLYVHNAAKYASPRQIETPFDLELLSARVGFGMDDYSGQVVSIENDIPLPNFSNNHAQIGSAAHPTFRGTLDGAGHTISNLRMSKRNTSLAFFNDFGGVLKNLEISGSIDIDDEDGDLQGGGFALTATDATIINLRSNIDVTVTSETEVKHFSNPVGEQIGNTHIAVGIPPGNVDMLLDYFALTTIQITVSFAENLPFGFITVEGQPSPRPPVRYGESLLSAPVLHETTGNYTLIGWSTELDAESGEMDLFAGDVLLDSSTRITDTEYAVTLYGVWVLALPAQIKTVTFNIGGSEYKCNAVIGTEIDLSLVNAPQILVSGGLVFKGWSASIPFDEQWVALPDIYMVTASATLYAIYK